MITTQVASTSGADTPGARTPNCAHEPCCPAADAADHVAAHVISAHPEQGWSLLCNGVVAFEDFGELLPNGTSVASPRATMLLASPHRKVS